MPFGKDVDLGSGDIVLDRDAAPPKGAQPPSPIFCQYLFWPNDCMDHDDTWYGGRPQPRRHCVTWGIQIPLKRGTAPPLFGACLLWPNGRPSQLLLSTC